MIEIKEVTIPKLTGKHKRRAYIYLPDSYEQEPERRYPVLYMFDGHNVFFDDHATYGKSWGMKEYMDYTNKQIIIAAVECNHSPNHGRLKEYSPYTFQDPEVGRIPGKGKKYMDWLVNVFKPMIDENYRTLPDREHTMIAGSSMGGLMSFYAVMEYNHVFSRAACLSPSFHFMMKRIARLIRETELVGETIIYMDYGSEEMKHHEGMLKPYIRVQSMVLEKGVFLESRIVPYGDHSEASWERQLPFFMNTILYGIE